MSWPDATGVSPELRERAEQVLHRRDAILEAVSRAAGRLLEERRWTAAAPGALRQLGEAVAASRAYIFEVAARPDGTLEFSQRWEWVVAGIRPEIDNPYLQHQAFVDCGLSRFERIVGRNGIYADNVRDLPTEERPIFESQGIRSIMTVPIFVEGEWWGYIGFDDCLSEREWSAAEADALRLAASLMAAAVKRDRSEQTMREQEQKLQAVFDTALDGIFILDDERRYVDVNDAGAALLGLSRAEVIGRRMDEFCPANQLSSMDEDWSAYLAANEPVVGEWQLVRPDGRQVVAEASTRPNFLSGLHLAFYRDVSERKRLEEELLEAQKMEALGRLAGGVAHDFNNMLTAITGYTVLLLERTTDPATARDLAQIRDAAERSASLTRQLLAFGRRQILQPRSLDLNDVVGGVASLLGRLLGEHIRLVVETEPELGTVRADVTQIERVLVNLAMNARNAMPDGGTLTVATRNVPSPNGEMVAIEVADTGVGMDESIRAHIFEPFFTTQDEGVGLGLASVYGIVRQSGGEVAVESEQGGGSRFTILLPRVPGPPEPLTPDSGGEARYAGAGTVLLVEDEEVVRTFVRVMLEQDGYTVLEAASGDEALVIAAKHAGPIDLLLTDVVMPGLSGHELAESITATNPDICVLYMSGYADESLIGLALRAERGFIAKPFSADTLAAKVRETLAPGRPSGQR